MGAAAEPFHDALHAAARPPHEGESGRPHKRVGPAPATSPPTPARLHRHGEVPMRWRFGPYLLDVARRELRVAGRVRPLQPQVFAVLAYLVRHRERVIPKDELLRVLWPDAIVTDASLQRAVSLARRALLPADRRLLRTYARHGYRFLGEVEGGDASGWAAPLPAPRYVRRGEVHVAYRTLGQGPIDLVMVLGWSLSMRSALELSGAELLLRDLSTRARVVLFDKRGTGASDRVKVLPGMGGRVEDLEAVLDAIRSPGAIVVGFSEGGPLALALAATRPGRVRGLALVGAFARMAAAQDHADGWRDLEIATLRGYIRERWGTGATMAALVPARHRSPEVQSWAARAEQEGASPGAALDLLEMNLAIDVRPLLGQVRVPTTVLHATSDPVVRVGNGRALAAAIPGARLVEVPGEDHAFLFGGRPVLERELAALLGRAALHASTPLT